MKRQYLASFEDVGTNWCGSVLDLNCLVTGHTKEEVRESLIKWNK